MKARGLDIARCEILARRASAGDGQACRELVEHLWPTWIDLVRANRRMKALAHGDDHVHNVVARLIDRIARHDGHGLRHYPAWRDRHPQKNFGDWVRIVTTNLVRDYVREQLGPRRDEVDEPSAKRILNEFALSPAIEQAGVRPPMTGAQTARELLEYARARLVPPRLHALELWLAGASFEQIDQELGVAAGEGRKLLRAAVAVLRRHFAGVDDRDGMP